MDRNTMNWFLWIIVGGIAGWLASRFMHSRFSLVMNVVVGIIGGVVGGLLMSTIGMRSLVGFDLGSVVIGFIGAVALLWVLDLFANRGKGSI